MYSPRLIEKTIENQWLKIKPPFNTLILAGARQCGKSTLLDHLFPANEHCHINLAEESGLCEAIDATTRFTDFSLLLETRLGFKPDNKRVLVIDEAQLSKRLGAYVRFFKEKWQTQRVILTGSTLSTLFNEHEKPVGRVDELVLRPFNFLEFLTALEQTMLRDNILCWNATNPLSQTAHNEALSFMQIYLKTGGLPAAVMAYKDKQDFERVLANIYGYYKRDFEGHVSQNLTSLFQQCFQRIAATTGAPVKNASIVKSSSPGYTKVAQVLSILEQWHLIIKVDIEMSRLSTNATATPKRYIFDHGIRYLQNPARFTDLSILDIHNEHREDIGGVIENFVLTELLSLNAVHTVKAWNKTHQSGQVDFIFQNQKIHAIEVKAATKFNSKHLAALLSFKEFYKKSELILCSLDKGGVFESHSHMVTSIPAYAVYAYFI